MIQYRFSNKVDMDFSSSLKSRVNAYFKENSIGKNANREMVVKSVCAISMYLVPYYMMLIFQPSNIPLLFLLWIIMGAAIAFIGTSVMHDSIHRSYSSKKRVNQMMGISTLILGMDPTIWNIQHNVLHHSYTNIEHLDEDIEPRYVLRFSPNQPLRWFHRYQHIYAMFFYAISTLIWVTIKDFVKAFQYRKKGHLDPNRSFVLFIVEMVIRKATYFTFILVLPIILLPVSPWWVVGMFVAMHLTAGILLSMVFQPAHVIDTSTYYKTDKDMGEYENWLVHQLRTTTNFGMDNKVLSWLCGGLNFQIEHHLFPQICHVHYSEISKIVQKTVKEYDLPYHSQKTMGMAIYKHFSMLKQLGRGQL